MNHHEQLKKEEIKTLLWRLAVPAIIGMTFNALYNIVDSIFVGMHSGEQGIAAISIVMPVMFLSFAIALMLGVGASSIYSRSLGAEQYERAKASVNSVAFWVLVIALVFTVLGLLFNEQLGYAFGMQESFKVESMNYLNVIFYGTVFQFFSVYYNNLSRADGKAKLAMIAMVAGVGTNIVLDPIFIFTLDMGTLGAAIATVIGYIVSFVILLVAQYKLKLHFRLQLAYLKPNVTYLKEAVLVGTPMLIRNSTGAIIAISMNNLLSYTAVDPVTAIAVYGIFTRLTMFLIMPIFGINQGMMPIVGFNFGAKQYDRVKEVKGYAVRIMSVYLIVVYLLFLFFIRYMLLLFGLTGDALEYGVYHLRYALAGIMFIAVQINLMGYFQSLGRPKIAIILSLLRQIILLLPIAFILTSMIGEAGVWIAILASDIISSMISWWLNHKEHIRFEQFIEA